MKIEDKYNKTLKNQLFKRNLNKTNKKKYKLNIKNDISLETDNLMQSQLLNSCKNNQQKSKYSIDNETLLNTNNKTLLSKNINND